MTINRFIILLIIFSTMSCVDEFQPQLDEFSNVLVVDGVITNEEGPYTIKLSVSTGLNIKNIEPVTGAEVYISEEDGPSELLTEVTPGTYRTKAGGMQGVIGKSYRLNVSIDGREYETDYEELETPAIIESVEAELEFVASFETPEPIPGMQFYINSNPSPNEESYYLWTMEGTYRYNAGLLIYYVYEGYYREFDNHDSLNTCYRTYDINTIVTASTENLSTTEISNKPLFFLPGTDNKLSSRYSMLTNQYTISKKAYAFWRAVENQSVNGSSLYATQPYQIRGNLVNKENPEEAVLGYFLVAGVSKNRIFIDPPEEVRKPLEPCTPDPQALRILRATGPQHWPIYLPGGDVPLGYVDQECVNCELLGGVLEKPEFWID